MPQSSLDNLARIANMSHELQTLNQQIKVKQELPVLNSHDNSAISSPKNGQGEVSGSSKNSKAKRMACVECRQQKSKCDAHEKHPEPCTRCAKKRLKCDLKSDYKRTYKRARIAEIEKEFSELKKTLSANQPEFQAMHQAMNQAFNTNSYSSPHQIVHNRNPNNIPNFQTPPAQYLQSNPTYSQPSIIQPQFQPQPSQLPQQGLSSHLHEMKPTASPFEPYSRHSSDTNNSRPNTPSVYRPLDGSTAYGHTSVKVPERDPKVVVPEYALVCEDKHLDSIMISSENIRELYLEFVERYHPILPVVDVTKGPERIYKLCPALFWVIMFVSLRRWQGDMQKTLLIQLSPLVKGILAEIVISPITRYNPTEEDEPILNGLNVYAVQAFLLYSFWPPITSSLSADSAYSTVGNAFYQAIRIGIHSPGPLFVHETNQKTPQQVSMAQENAKTWIVCNIASQTIATSFGFPAFVQFDSSIWTLFGPNSTLQVPKSIKFMMEIAYFEDQVAKTLNSNPLDTYGLAAPTERLPLLKLLTRRLDELEMRMAHELPNDDGFRKFQLLSSRVHLLTYYFMDTSLIAQFELERGLVQLYNAAIALISHTEKFQMLDKSFVRYLPGVYILDIWQAACIIGKLIHSSLKRVIDIGSGKIIYETAISLAAKASILKHDVAHRASGIMRNMWQLFRTLDEKKMSTLTINIRGRLSASVFFDCMYLLRDQVGMIKLNSRHDAKANADTEENDDGEGSYDEEEYGYNNEEAVVSDTEVGGKATSQKSTPGSTTSSGKKRRSLSSTTNAEYKARKIIRTIPLDPQPIGVGKTSNIFKIVHTSNDSSPTIRNDMGSAASLQSPEHMKISQRYARSNMGPPDDSRSPNNNNNNNRNMNNNNNNNNINNNNNNNIKNNNVNYNNNNNNNINIHNMNQHSNSHNVSQHNYSDHSNNNYGNGNQSTTPQFVPFNDSPLHASLETIDFEVNGDLLWKDVDTVMNDFGFNI